jgi:uncharacterized membrane protein YhaH (DUF805 family)
MLREKAPRCFLHRAYKHARLRTPASETERDIVMNTLKLLWSFHGRIGRGAYAGGLLLNFAWATAALIGVIYLGRDEMLEAYPSLQLGALAVPTAALFIGAKAAITTLFTWGMCGLVAKRLHDLGYPGWICLVVLIPVVDVIAVNSLLLARGDDFDNPYGPSRNQLGGPGTGALALNR